MKKERLTNAIIFYLFIMAVGASCVYTQTVNPSTNHVDNKPPIETNTKITREALWKRMILKKIRFSESSDCDRYHSSVKKTSDASDDSTRLEEQISKSTQRCGTDFPNVPDPLALQIEITRGYRNSFKARLNNEEFDFDGLVSKLNLVFKEREANGIFQEGTGDVDTRITIAASDDYISEYRKHNVTAEDIERLIDDLREKGIDKISVDFIGLLPFPLSLPDSPFIFADKRKTVNRVKPSKRSKRRAE